jgi:hypothetical protein
MQAEQQSEASPTQVVRTYWKLALEGNIEQTVSYETNTDGKIVALESAETGSWAEIIHQKGLVLLDTRDEIINGDKAQLVAEVRYPNGKINTLQHNLHKESGKWKILTVYSVDPLTCKYLPEMCNFVEMPNTGGVGHK